MTTSKQKACGKQCSDKLPENEGAAKRSFQFAMNKSKPKVEDMSLDDFLKEHQELDPDDVEDAKVVDPVDIKTATELLNINTNIMKPVNITKKELSEEEKWQSYVSRAQGLISKMANHRIEIAQIAQDACNVKHGGGSHWSGHEGVYTLKKFAQDVGINAKTLSNWVRVKRLSEKLKSFDPINDWQTITLAASKLSLDDPPEKVQADFEKWKNTKEKFNHGRYLLQGLRRVRSLSYYLENRAKTSQLDADEVAELKMHCQKIVKWVNNNYK